MCYVSPALIEEAAGARRSPLVRDLFVDDPNLAQDGLFVAAVARLVQRHAVVAAPRAGRERDKVRAVRDRLSDDLLSNPSLDDLAGLVGLSRYRLCRAFRRETGMPDHRYQAQARVDRARATLAAGRTPAEAASSAGFADQSHLGRHFKRLVRITTGELWTERRAISSTS